MKVLLNEFCKANLDDDIWGRFQFDPIATAMNVLIQSGTIHICFEGEEANGLIYVYESERFHGVFPHGECQDVLEAILEKMDEGEYVKLTSRLPVNAAAHEILINTGFEQKGQLTREHLCGGVMLDTILYERLHPDSDKQVGVETVIEKKPKRKPRTRKK